MISETAHPRAGLARAAVLALALIACGRVVSTYRVFSEAADEHHFVAGIEWWDRGAYTYTIFHPPLARVAAALPLYLAGARAHGLPIVAEKNAILYSGKGYPHNLALARLGILPFLPLAILPVWLWTRRLFGSGAALAATLLFTTLSPVLAHAGLATTDAAVMATLSLAFFAFWLWLEEPSLPRGLFFGLAGGLAVLSKSTALPFFFWSAVAILLLRLWIEREKLQVSRTAGTLAIAAVLAASLVWAGYRFSWGPLASPPDTSERILRPVEQPGAARVPAPEYFDGLRQLRLFASLGHPAYLFGRYSRTGWWYYFPVALAVKTPLPFLLLSMLGAGVSISLGLRRRDWRLLAAPAAAGVVLLVSLTSRIDIGIRHLLPIYPLLAIAAGWGVAALWSRPGRAGRAAAVVLLAWQVFSSVRAHPDYLADFNELAGRHPDRILLDSNLDWGQDLFRLSEELSRRGVDSVALAYFGNADLSRHGLPPIRPLPPDHPTTGWVAISEMWLKDVGGEGKAYRWLREREPVARVGRSILLYFIGPQPAR